MKQNKDDICMKVIGLTGGVGSGKSLVADLLERKYQAYLINMDQIAHNLMKKGNLSYQLILEYFGMEILNEAGEIDRKKLGSIAYKDEERLSRLNSFTHPYVIQYTKKQIEEQKEKRLVCVETALPLQAGLEDYCDEIWYVFAPEEVRRERLKKTRNYDDKKIEMIFKNQITEEEYKRLSTHVLENYQVSVSLEKQIEILLAGK
ncbi:dephospho-CoA kinase [Anaerocolumna cellulosilytica]|uniref:Dephospho-CoA kinase n=1 Tax=Anaerocolumna cellulosilytica TaxID=433286 RepID=A0A6S6R6U3_9FIRM|nr:dephospho-CoA kinase [Anaerocolumna cellulosilytica]MBB5196996.1 dephospho-CoA kinase [Anaerocolumna cellulosilytica]BCJ95210.1 dephospho-CoA kinase [Anaerocolumna cellulosilytica]